MSEKIRGWERGAASDYLRFRNGATSPDRTAEGAYRVYGANGHIGFADKTNAPARSVVIGRVGSYCGSVHFSEEDSWVTDNAIVANAVEDREAKFWSYKLQTVRLNELSSGSGQSLINQKILNDLPVEVPPSHERIEIAEVLGALDDKIAANSKAATLAETIADAEFKKMSKSIPAGPTFQDVATVSGGGTPSTKVDEYWNGAVSWATPTDMTSLDGTYLESTARTITEEGLRRCASKLFSPGTILMTSRATIGAIAFAGIPAAVNQGFIVVEPDEQAHSFWLFHEMKSRVTEFIAWANGATFLELSRGSFKKLKVRIPARTEIDAFNARVVPLHSSARLLRKESTNLANLRDALLPRLMSGRLRVRDAEKLVSGAV